MHPIAILIPAAGTSSRMNGRDKLLEPVRGQPMLGHIAEQALATGWPVYVSLNPAFPARLSALDGHDVTRVDVKHPEGGMAASIRDAMQIIANEASAVMILPADMPDLKTEHFQWLAAHFETKPECIARAGSADGSPGHPVIFPARLFGKLRHLPDGEGAKPALAGEAISLFPLPGTVAVTDLDTRDDWARWRARQSDSA